MATEVESTSVSSSKVSIPDEQPKPEKSPAYMINPPNFADKEETAAEVVRWVKSFYDDFEAQDAWTKFKANMDSADEMYRAAVNRTELDSQESANKEDTRSKVKSGTFYADMNIITSGEIAIILGKETQLPAVYEPLPDSTEYTVELGQILAEERNAVFAYTIEKADMRGTNRKAIWTLNKYGNAAVEMQWDFRKENRWVKKPTKWDEIETANGNIVQKPVKFKKEKKLVTVANHPRMVVHDMRNVRFDAMIDDVQDQSCIVLRTQKQLSELWGEALAGKYKNMDKITTDQLYSDEGRNKELTERQSNADEGGDASQPNTLFDVYYGWVRVPVNDDTGEWSPDSEIAHWYQYVMVGSIDKKPVPVRIAPIPFSCGKIPFNVVHALEDDKGALHMGYADLEKSIIAQEMTSIDQAIDNVTARNQKPWIVERGSISTRDKTFTAGGNKLYQKKPGAQDPHEMDTADTTGFTLNFLNWLNEYRRRVVGINDPLAGEALGGRTSAAEALAVFEQALKPALEAATYKANQLLPFEAFWVSEMWKDFGDPDLVINLTGKSPVKQVKPADIFGDMRVRVTAIKQFQDGILRRKEETEFIQQIIPLALQNGVMGPKELAEFLREIATSRDFDNAARYFAAKSNFDSVHVARAENQNIVWHGVIDLPQQGEDHETHLQEHKSYLGAVQLLPEGERPAQENLDALKLHIQQTEALMQQDEMQAQPAVPEMGAQTNQGLPPSQPPRTEGELFGDTAGALENPAAPIA